MALTIWATASAQSLVEPERIAAVQQAFDSAATARQMRCRIDAVRPALDYAMRFRTGYVINLPMAQFQGTGHSLETYLRITPEGLKPTYLESTGNLPEVPATKLDGEIGGTFVVGEGAYDVEALVTDDSHRACHAKWRIQARRSGSERELAPATSASTVEELSVNSFASGDSRPSPRIGRLTLMLHAAPLSPRSSKLQDSDVSALTGSLFSLLQQLPARSVRLVVFNLDQRAVLFRQDDFAAKDLEKVITAIKQLQLARVDYKTLQQPGGPSELLSDLLQAELRDPQAADALILLGPRLVMRDDVPIPAVDKPPAAVPSLFYLQYQTVPGLMPGSAQMRGGAARRPRNPDDPGSRGVETFPMPLGLSDSIEKLIGRLKGKTIAVRSPHDLADGIRHIQTGIGTPCGADPLVRGRPPGRPDGACGESNVADPRQRDEGVPRGPGGPPHNQSGSATANKSSNPPEASATGAAAPTHRAAGILPSQPEGPLNLPKPDKLPQAEQYVPDVDPVELLMRVRDQVVEHASRIPNHTCVETIQRDRYEPTAARSSKSCDAILAARQGPSFPPRLRLDTSDRLRLDVAKAPDREIYSWAGATKFEEAEIDEWLPEGAIGTGPFATHLIAVFENRDPKFIFEGDTTLAGRSLMEYSFAVPRKESHYRVKAHKEWVITGYTGTLLVDPKTAELVRLTVRTEELPPATTDCETDTTLDYGTVQLGGDDYLLPKLTRQRFIGRDGEEDENTVTFSACREYQAESRLTFAGGAGAAGDAPGSTPASTLDLPPGLPVTVDLITAIDSDQSAAGDVMEGRLTKPIRDARQKTLVPEGARVQGRLMRVETRHSVQPEYTIALRWESVEIDGVKMPISLRPDRQPGISVSGLPGALVAMRRRGMAIELPRPGEGAYGVYHSRVGRVESGFRTEWLTARP